MRVVYKGKECEVVKHAFYCKAGPYDHKSRNGWVLVLDRMIVLGDRVLLKNICDGAMGYEWPEFITRKELLESLEDFS